MGAGRGPAPGTRVHMFRSQSEAAEFPSPSTDSLQSPHIFSDSSSNDSPEHVPGCTAAVPSAPDSVEEPPRGRHAGGKPGRALGSSGGRAPSDGSNAAEATGVLLAAPFLQTHVYSDKKRGRAWGSAAGGAVAT